MGSWREDLELDTIRGSGACASCVGGEGGVYGEAN
jgi:hypothetical protein